MRGKKQAAPRGGGKGGKEEEAATIFLITVKNSSEDSSDFVLKKGGGGMARNRETKGNTDELSKPQRASRERRRCVSWRRTLVSKKGGV